MEGEFKVVTVGESGVGKTTLITRFYNDIFLSDPNSTIGSALIKCDVAVGDECVTLSVWDTAGQEKFHSLLPLYLRNAYAVILVYDAGITNMDNQVFQLYDSIKNDLSPGTNIYVCGNKVDLVDPGYSNQSIEEWCITNGHKFFTTSAKTGLNVNRLFYQIASDCINKGVNQTETKNTDIVTDIIGAKPHKGACC